MTKEERLEAEKLRIDDMYSFERSLCNNTSFIFGIDEAGRGPLCGPVVTACVILPEEPILWLNDSKKLSEKKREELFPIIRERAVSYGIGMAGPERIDQINILNATLEAMKEAYESCISMLEGNNSIPLDRKNHLILVDGNKTIPGIRETQMCIIGGDAKCPSVSAASILAKVTRDRLLEEYDQRWPEYGFAKHKGYGTKEHIEALKKYGALPIHRRSFISKFVNE